MARRSIVETEARLQARIEKAEADLETYIKAERARIAAFKECLADMQAPAESEEKGGEG